MNFTVVLLASTLSCAAFAAPAGQAQSAAGLAGGAEAAPSAVRIIDSADTKKQEPSAVPCPPQETRKEKLDNLAKLEGAGESHSTNCPAQGTIKETPEKAIH